MTECAGRDVVALSSAHPEESFARLQRDRAPKLGLTLRCVVWAAALLAGGQIVPQEAPANPSASPGPATKVPWAISITVDGYLPPQQDDYVGPIIAADHGWLHLEARYNYEDQGTGSVWVGYNFRAGKALVLNLTPMVGGVFGRSKGIAPGLEFSLTYKRITLSSQTEYVFDTSNIHRSFYYSEPQLTYSLTDWLRVGLAAQHTKALETGFDIQRGFLVGVSHKHAEFTTYVYNAGWGAPTAVLELGWSF